MKMNTKNMVTIIAITLVFASNAVFGQVTIDSATGNSERSSISVESTDNNSNNSIAGSWYVTATPNGGPPPFKAMITFSDGGGMTASAQGDILLNLNSLATAGHGAWVRTGNSQFLFTFRQIFYTADGSYDGGIKVRHTANMNRAGTAWTGQITAEFYNAADEVVFTSNGSGTATRIVAEPLLP